MFICVCVFYDHRALDHVFSLCCVSRVFPLLSRVFYASQRSCLPDGTYLCGPCVCPCEEEGICCALVFGRGTRSWDAPWRRNRTWIRLSVGGGRWSAVCSVESVCLCFWEDTLTILLGPSSLPSLWPCLSPSGAPLSPVFQDHYPLPLLRGRCKTEAAKLN